MKALHNFLPVLRERNRVRSRLWRQRGRARRLWPAPPPAASRALSAMCPCWTPLSKVRRRYRHREVLQKKKVKNYISRDWGMRNIELPSIPNYLPFIPPWGPSRKCNGTRLCVHKTLQALFVS